MKKIIKQYIILILCILWAHPLFAQKQKTPQLIPVTVMKIIKSKATITQNLAGNIVAYKTVEVRARVNGIIQKRFFTEGAFVKKGDILFKLEDKIFQATLELKEAALENTIASSELVIKTFKRYTNLLAKGVVSQQEYDTYEVQYKQVKAQIKQAKAELKIAKINLAYTTIIAPISGRIDKALINEGGLAVANNTKLTIIKQLDQVYIDFTQPVSQLNQRQKIQQSRTKTTEKNIVVLLNNVEEYSKKAQLQFAAMEVDQTTGARPLRALVDNPDRLLLPGMFVRIKFPVLDKQNIIKIPQKSVHILASGPSVYIVKDNKLTPLPVLLGEMTDKDWIINSGLKIGQRIVVSDITVISQTQMPVVGMTVEEMQQTTQQSK